VTTDTMMINDKGFSTVTTITTVSGLWGASE